VQPDPAFVVLDRGPFRQPLTQHRQQLSHGGEVFRRLLHFAPNRTLGNLFRLIAGIAGPLCQSCLVCYLGARGLQWTVATIQLDRISSGKFKKISRFAAFVPVEG
jgi:hypothetical protein